jgi:hypothetical protein
MIEIEGDKYKNLRCQNIIGWINRSIPRKRIEEVREAKTKLEEQKAETVVKIQEVQLFFFML